MADRMAKSEWALLPTKKTLDAMNALSDFNKTAAADKRKRFTEVCSIGRRRAPMFTVLLGTT